MMREQLIRWRVIVTSLWLIMLGLGVASRAVGAELLPIRSGVMEFNQYTGRGVAPSPLEKHEQPGAPLAPFRTDIRVNQDSGTVPHNEPSLAVNPRDPLNLVAGANDYRSGGAACGFYSSLDGGLTWRPDGLLPLGNKERAGDPALTFGPDGTAYYACLRFNSSDYANDITVFRSADGGRTWPASSTIMTGTGNSDFNDKEYIAADRTGGAFNGRLYVTWTHFGLFGFTDLMEAHSSDGGVTWSNPQSVSFGLCLLFNTDCIHGSIPAVGPNGEVYVAWGNRSFLQDEIKVAKSTDGGVTWGAGLSAATITVIPNPLPGFLFRTNIFSTMAVDTTNGPCRGVVYVAWADYQNGDADIFLTRSIDGGDTFLQPIRADHAPAGVHSFFPWLAVDPSRGVHVIYYDNRTTRSQLDVFHSFSANCGASFSATDDRVSDSSFDPSLDGFRGQFIGDYIGAVASERSFHAAFMSTAPRGHADIFADREDILSELLCDIQLNKTSFVNGDPVIAQVLRLANPTTVEIPVELKIWFEVPPGPTLIPFVNIGADGSVKLPAGFTTNAGPLTLFTVTAAFPRGSYAFRCRILNPVTGGLRAEDLDDLFTIQ